MKKTIRGKKYEFIEGDCEDCVFQMHPGCGSPLELDECVNLDESKVWKEVKDDQNTSENI